MTIDWQTLNAYVDGELAPGEAARVAAAMARQPKLAARVATLSRLKAVANELQPPLAAPAPPLPPRRAPTTRQGLALAAAALAAVAILALWFWPASAPPGPLWLDSAVTAHLEWLARTPEGDGGAPQPVALDQTGTAGIPDLSEAHLTLVYVNLVPGRGQGHGLQLGYRGIHGCRVSLWIAEATAGLGETPAAVGATDVAGYAWRVGESGFALLARGMDPDRLRLLATTVARMTRQGQEQDAETRIALRQTTQTGAPCST